MVIDEMIFATDNFIYGVSRCQLFQIDIAQRRLSNIATEFCIHHVQPGFTDNTLLVVVTIEGQEHISLVDITSGKEQILVPNASSVRYDHDNNKLYFIKSGQSGLWRLDKDETVLIDDTFTIPFEESWTLVNGAVYRLATYHENYDTNVIKKINLTTLQQQIFELGDLPILPYQFSITHRRSIFN